ncbi:MAG: co-chaperone GroES [Candidatus Saccharibacteria bacterium]|nr:co-chaperone GroES [Candidatus Saccharibacteria bacterium]
MTSIRPLNDKIVAEKPVVKTQTASGLYLPETAKERSTSAQVIAVGPEVKTVKKGDQIIYKEYSTTDIKLGEQEFLIIKEEDVLGVIEGDK